MKQARRSVDICICTFRRDTVVETIKSLSQLRLSEALDVKVIVCDNDDKPSAKRLIQHIADQVALPIRYIHIPGRNISIARNALLDASAADLIAFVDDDETVTPGWLEALVLCMDAQSADVVLGPVRAIYGPEMPSWMVNGDFHSTLPVSRDGEILTGYTCNVLMRSSSPSIAGRRFKLELGRSGGEDTNFFSEIHEAGGKIAFAPNAWVEEIVPASRASFRWLAQRRFRMGQTHGRIIARDTSIVRRSINAAIAMSKVGFCAAAALVSLNSVSRIRNVLRGTLHAGTVAGQLGVRELNLYGESGPEGGRELTA